MVFKDDLANDIRNIFFNFEEFGEEHTISGKKIVCIFDQDKFEAKRRNSLITTEDGVYQSGITIFLPTHSFKYRPHAKEVIVIDGNKYTVEECKEDMGVLEMDVRLCVEV